jgi:hypothetical protein
MCLLDVDLEVPKKINSFFSTSNIGDLEKMVH